MRNTYFDQLLRFTTRESLKSTVVLRTFHALIFTVLSLLPLPLSKQNFSFHLDLAAGLLRIKMRRRGKAPSSPFCPHILSLCLEGHFPYYPKTAASMHSVLQSK
jgi:hypothetical protein